MSQDFEGIDADRAPAPPPADAAGAGGAIAASQTAAAGPADAAGRTASPDQAAAARPVGAASQAAGASPAAETFRIDSLAFGGEGVARKDGKVAFVAGGLPGELVEVAPVFRRRRFDRYRVIRVIEPSPDREPPLCPHDTVCGGCTIQRLRYEAQLEAKAGQVRDCLERIGNLRVPECGAPVPSPVLTAYRNKMEYTFSTRAWRQEGPPVGPVPTPALGLHVPGRFDAVFDLEACALATADSVTALHVVREFARERGLTAWRSDTDQGLLRHLVVREGMNTNELLVALVAREEHPDFSELAIALSQRLPSMVGFVVLVNRRMATIAKGETERVLHGRSYLLEQLAGLTFAVQAQSFFQTNTWGAEALVRVMKEMLADPPRSRGGLLLDLYCGAGTLGLVLADQFDRVLGVEQVESAVADARGNAERNQIKNATFLQANVEGWARTSAPDDVAGVVVDPPRAGLHRAALDGVARLSPPWVLYVSCNPATLARDAALLTEAGYEPKAFRVVDMFPHTAHVESLLLLERVARP